MRILEIFDPPMCCSSGVCGREVEPKLAQFSGDLDWLKGQGVEVRRFNLAQEPQRFVERAAVKALLDRSGSDELPAIVVGDQIVSYGRYPTRAELAALVGLTPGQEKPQPVSGSACCGPKASSCC
jgi:hypothetical protein